MFNTDKNLDNFIGSREYNNIISLKMFKPILWKLEPALFGSLI